MSLPFVAVLFRVPLLAEGLREAFDGAADVRTFLVRGAEAPALLASLRPDAVIVDAARVADAALGYAVETGAPALHVDLPAGSVAVVRGGRWERLSSDGSPESIRNELVGRLQQRAQA